MTQFNIVEIFESLQGEGYNTGMPAIFIRLAACNLKCPWCDTDFMRYQSMSLQHILDIVQQYQSKNIIITGGEPTIHKKLPLLLQKLKQKNYYIALESNGLGIVDPHIDYIALSPKFHYRQHYPLLAQNRADEVRIVVEDHPEFIAFCQKIEQHILARHYFLSPCEQNNQFNILTTLQTLGKLNQHRYNNKWLLSLQTHKLANIE
ncbi:radical SAM protein [Snodgrassella alvi]|jgi:7-carboxy-7-deazaguanine synthase|uniref:7-carboxy-7-deazaguanine synthase n=1 Tax=Snodgrassella alvi TaxID=1196083 RepID=A0A2N9XDM5_9NEIS|nr:MULTISPECIES: 7-carboxy-7-deazaguanine synthase QueE [Snodgrassella]PIT11069.1 radical SAM protein [Snodgrassella communis]PIT45331.1 radical SAM protein [Snodgrassella alvi]